MIAINIKAVCMASTRIKNYEMHLHIKSILKPSEMNNVLIRY